MAKNAVYDYSVTAASNTDIDALDATGATGLVKSGDNYTRSLMSHLKAKANDDGAVNTVGGTGDAITVTLASNPTALVDGMRFSINAPGTNTGAVTIAVTNSGATLLGTKKVRKWSGGAETALSAGDITSGHILNLVYDSARDTAAGAFMIDGSASVAAATTSAAGIVELATTTEAFQASSATLAVTPAGLANLYSVALGLAIEVADLKGSRLNMAGGIADAYDSETDVDTATSTNETYDSGNDLYSPAVASTRITGATPTLPITGSNPENMNDNSAGTSITTTGGLGNLSAAALGARIFAKLDYGSNKTITSIEAKQLAQTPAGSTACKAVYSTDNVNWTQLGADFMVTTSAANFTRTGSVTARYIGIAGEQVNYSTNGMTMQDLNGYEDLSANMTLVSNAFTATAVPTVARIATFIDPQVSMTINTDFTAEVSRDGGTTWTAATLALVSNPVGTVEQYEGTVSISAQPSGSSMKYRLKTLNNKDIDVTGTVFQWG